MYLKYIPLNIKIYNIESFPRSGAKFIRAAGTWAKIVEKNSNLAKVLFSNGKYKKFSVYCSATIGRVSNINRKQFKTLYKAGQNRTLGFRPSVRGVVMNPVDHPHGGGKGKKSRSVKFYNYVRLLQKH